MAGETFKLAEHREQTLIQTDTLRVPASALLAVQLVQPTTVADGRADLDEESRPLLPSSFPAVEVAQELLRNAVSGIHRPLPRKPTGTNG